MNYYNIIKTSDLLEPYFKDENLKWCSVPVPSINNHKSTEFEFTQVQKDGYGQSQTHPSIAYIKDGFGGHKYWLAATPYPNSLGVFENPCIYYGDADSDGNPPVLFHPINDGVISGEFAMIDNPIVKVTSTTAVNSDNDLFFDEKNTKLGLISRDNTYDYAYYYQESLDGLSWSPRPPKDQYVIKKGDGMPAELVSPAVIVENGKKHMYGLRGVGYLQGSLERNSGINKGMLLYTGEFIKGGMQIIDKGSILGRMELHPWHFDIAKYNGKYYMCFCGVNRSAERIGMLYLAESEDGLDFYVFARPLATTKYSYYRPSIAFKEDGTFILYGCTESLAPKEAEKYPRGIQDVPVDGRAIFLATDKLSIILAKLKNDKILIG